MQPSSQDSAHSSGYLSKLEEIKDNYRRHLDRLKAEKCAHKWKIKQQPVLNHDTTTEGNEGSRCEGLSVRAFFRERRRCLKQGISVPPIQTHFRQLAVSSHNQKINKSEYETPKMKAPRNNCQRTLKGSIHLEPLDPRLKYLSTQVTAISKTLPTKHISNAKCGNLRQKEELQCFTESDLPSLKSTKTRTICHHLPEKTTSRESTSCFIAVDLPPLSTSPQKCQLQMAAWYLKTRALTGQVYVDELEADEEGIAEIVMDDNVIANVARPGTSLRNLDTSQSGIQQGVRPVSQGGRPLSGFVRPGTQTGRPGTMEQALRTPRTAHTARPVTSSSGRFVRLGTASMLSSPDGPFIQVAKLNLEKYAARPNLAKGLFEYIFHHENDIRSALELAALATQASQFNDWWWKIALAKCYYRLGMHRDAEKQLQSILKTDEVLDAYLHLGRVYCRLDQPLAAIEIYNRGLTRFPGETSLLTGIARVHEGMNQMEPAVKFYKDVLKFDSMSVEAIACIATHHFYSDQPEVALKFYRRLLQMGVFNAELFNNLGLCCFYSQQYDMTFTCFERALALADDDIMLGDVWFNIGHVAVGLCDTKLAFQCFRLALSHNNDHAEAYNNLGVLELRRNHVDAARSFFQASFVISPHLYEPHYNFAALADQMGDLQTSYVSAKRAVEAFPNHVDSKELLKQLKHHFAML